MTQIFQSDDGFIFETQAECEQPERQRVLYQFVHQNIQTNEYLQINASDVVEFIENHIDQINSILGKSAEVTKTDCWIFNTKTTDGHPPELKADDFIEVLYSSGHTDCNLANGWFSYWDILNPTHIVKYRKVTE
jgi:hypothetical protein